MVVVVVWYMLVLALCLVGTAREQVVKSVDHR